MSETTILTTPRLPARVDVQQVAQLLGFPVHDIPILMRAKLLKPLGDPAPNGHKYFCTAEIELLARDKAWLDKATKTVSRHWQARNDQQRKAANA